MATIEEQWKATKWALQDVASYGRSAWNWEWACSLEAGYQRWTKYAGMHYSAAGKSWTIVVNRKMVLWRESRLPKSGERWRKRPTDDGYEVAFMVNVGSEIDWFCESKSWKLGVKKNRRKRNERTHHYQTLESAQTAFEIDLAVTLWTLYVTVDCASTSTSRPTLLVMIIQLLRRSAHCCRRGYCWQEGALSLVVGTGFDLALEQTFTVPNSVSSQHAIDFQEQGRSYMSRKYLSG